MGRHSNPKQRATAQLSVAVIGVSMILGAAVAAGYSRVDNQRLAQFEQHTPITQLAEDVVVEETHASEPVPNFAACPATARACVDLTANKSWLQKDGKVEYGPVSINQGRPGWETPPGSYHVLRHVKDEVSMEFAGDKMPWSTYFSPLGIAFHEGALTEQSHGCIHMTGVDAEHYFRTLKVSESVVVFK